MGHGSAQQFVEFGSPVSPVGMSPSPIHRCAPGGKVSLLSKSNQQRQCYLPARVFSGNASQSWKLFPLPRLQPAREPVEHLRSHVRCVGVADIGIEDALETIARIQR